MSENGYRRVQTDGLDRSHVVDLGMFHDGTQGALCGRKPFPERWTTPADAVDFKPICPNCLSIRRGRQ